MFRFGKKLRSARMDDVTVDVSEKDGVRSLHLGSDAIQSAMRLRDPFELVLGYSRCMFGYLLFRDPAPEMVVIGLGGGSIPKFVWKYLPQTRVTAVELHPSVVQIARSMFLLPPDDERLQVVTADGADFIRNLLDPVDVIMLDAYSEAGIAEALSTTEFFLDCRDRLNADGVLVVNLWGSDPKFGTYVDRLSDAFDGRVICLPARQRGNVVALCFCRTNHNPTWDSLTERAKQLSETVPLEFTEFVSDLSRLNEHNDRRLLI